MSIEKGSINQHAFPQHSKKDERMTFLAVMTIHYEISEIIENLPRKEPRKRVKPINTYTTGERGYLKPVELGIEHKWIKNLQNLKTQQNASWREKINNYAQLMKPGIMVLLVLEAITAMIVAAGRSTSPFALIYLAIAGTLASGGSASVNQYLERDKDILMARTDWRPVATQRIPPRNALIFGVASIALSLIVAEVAFNYVATLMILFGALSYVFLYTLFLKPRTQWNIVIGGVAGVFPALTGWAAVTGNIGIPALFIGALVFLWTPPHFWGLSMKFKEDYVKTGYPMLPVVKTEKQVINWIVVSSIPLLVFSLLPIVFPFLGSFGLIYSVIAAAVAIPFVIIDINMLREPTKDNGFKAFLISLPYMFILFGAMIATVII